MGFEELDEARQSDRVCNGTIYSSSRDSEDPIGVFTGPTAPRDADPESGIRWLAILGELITGNPSIMSMSEDNGSSRGATQTEGTLLTSPVRRRRWRRVPSFRTEQVRWRNTAHTP